LPAQRKQPRKVHTYPMEKLLLHGVSDCRKSLWRGSAQAFSWRRRCPSAHTGADVVRGTMLRFSLHFRRIRNISRRFAATPHQSQIDSNESICASFSSRRSLFLKKADFFNTLTPWRMKCPLSSRQCKKQKYSVACSRPAAQQGGNFLCRIGIMKFHWCHTVKSFLEATIVVEIDVTFYCLD